MAEGSIPSTPTTPLINKSHTLLEILICYHCIEMKKSFVSYIVAFNFLLSNFFWFILFLQFRLNNPTHPYLGLDSLWKKTTPDIHFITFIIFLLTTFYVINYFLITKYNIKKSWIKIFLVTSCISIFLNILTFPFVSLDMFNYLMYLKMFYHFGANPYTTIPALFLPDQLIERGFIHELHLFYGPGWLFASFPQSFFSNFQNADQTILIHKIASAFYIAGTSFFIYRMTEEKHQWIGMYFFLGNPLILFEGIVNGHSDGLLALLLIISLYLALKKSLFSLPVFIVALFTKYFLIAVLPFFLVLQYKNTKSLFRMFASITIVTLTLFLLFAPLWSHGKIIEGMLGSVISSQESFYNASLYSMFRELIDIGVLQIPQNIALSFCIAIFSFIFLFIFRNWLKMTDHPETAMGNILLVFFCILSLFYPWYIIPVFALFCIRPNTEKIEFLLLFTISGFGYYFVPLVIFYHFQFNIFISHCLQASILGAPVVWYFSRVIKKFPRS